MKKNKIISVTLTIIIVVFAVGYLMFSSLGDTMIYYKTVDEILTESVRFDGKEVRVNGVLVPTSVRQKPGTDQFRFQLSKRGQVLEVAYAGILPDSMQDGGELVVQGALQASQKLFVADQILTKCPSKHEAEAKAIEP
ncbi:MAG: cytochrome c maturation protein CcmE [Proteobacteria bacterium]|nr:cytochrome c maturation protein CcmE [Pseudomonadota bacterium]